MKNLTKEYILLNEDLFSVSGVLNIGFKWDHLLPGRRPCIKGFIWGVGVILKKPYTDWVKISSNPISFGVLKTVFDPSSGLPESSSAF